MFWDCEYCGTKGLLAKTNRHCPSCGAVQDAERRYFPPDGQETQVHNHTFEGPDRVCSACTTPNGAKANNCRNCGNPLAGEKSVTLKSARPKPPPPKPTGLSLKTKAMLAGLGLLVVFIIVTVLWKKSVHVEVTGHAWHRDVGIESYGPRAGSDWCGSMPSGAYKVSRSREVRSQKKIPDGETCTTEKYDRGDGTFEKKRVCHTKYKSEPVYDDKCHYTVDRWEQSRSVTAAGTSLTPAPYWPEVHLSRTGQCHGCEREGARSSAYEVLLHAEAHDYRCNVGESVWPRYQIGDPLPLKVRVVTGGADCSSLHPIH